MNIQPTSSYSEDPISLPQSQANNRLHGRKVTYSIATSLSIKERVISLLKAFIATIPSFGFALFSDSVRSLWKNGIEGKLEKKFTTILTEDDISSESQTTTHSKMNELFHNSISQETKDKLIKEYELFCDRTAQIGLEKTIKERPDFIRFVDLSRATFNTDTYKLAEKAIENDSTCIRFIDRDAPDYQFLCEHASREKGDNIRFIDKNEVFYYTVALIAISKDAESIQYIDKDTINYEGLAEIAIKKNPENIQFIDKKAGCYIRLAKEVIDNNPDIILTIDKNSDL